MMSSPMTPATIFRGFGALTIGSKNGGSAMSALEAAGDLERHQRGRPGQILAGNHEVDFLELPGSAELGHEIRDRRGGECRPGDFDLPATLFESGDPEIIRDDIRERVGEQDRPSLGSSELLDDLDPLAQFVGQVLDLGLLSDLHLQEGELFLRLIDVGGERRLGPYQDPPVPSNPEQQDQVDDAEQPAEVERRQAEFEPCAPPASPFGRKVDPDHFCLSPGRRNARPTATARAGPAALTSSAYARSTSMRWKGFVSSTGMPQFDDR